ncbi:MAG: transcriptional repressor NrdR [Deltaproteobacteria bacterium]|nr:transcriptional repressor NrdR [Deltaproteobacteria bacterium]
MKCPFCSFPEDKVIDSRIAKDHSAIRRRRECLSCNRRFTTFERIEISLPLVIKQDQSREAYDRHKVENGIRKACEKRPVSQDQIEGLVNELEQVLRENGEKEVAVAFIGEHVMAALKELDDVAYIRFASVYRQFKDINEFMQELQGLLKHNPGSEISQ